MNNISPISRAILKGAKLYASVSGGKDGQAMTIIVQDHFDITGMVHADLGRSEWKESIRMCERQACDLGIPLNVVHRSDGLDLVSYIERRKDTLSEEGRDVPFWPSSASRYCTSDTKRGPINKFYNSTGHNFLISCEGIRAEESTARAKKEPLTIRAGSSNYYSGMTVERAIESYRADKKLWLTWFPIFEMKLPGVWATYNHTSKELDQFRKDYKATKQINPEWKFHPAYVKGNNRVSCTLCVLGDENDLMNGIEESPELAMLYSKWEIETGFTFRKNFSITEAMAKSK